MTVPDDQRRVDFEVVGPPVGVFEQLTEVLQTHLLGHAGLTGHHVEADLERRVAEAAVGVDGGLHAVAAVHLAVDALVGRLDADFDLRRAKSSIRSICSGSHQSGFVSNVVATLRTSCGLVLRDDVLQ